jgi:hypothetical protein
VLSVDGVEGDGGAPAPEGGGAAPAPAGAAPGPAAAGAGSVYGTPTPRSSVPAGTPFSEPLPAGPAWVRSPYFVGEGQWSEFGLEQWQENAATVAAANASATHYDYVQYGDSLTKHLARNEGLRLWQAAFSEANGFGPTAPLGVVGNDIADLMVGPCPRHPACVCFCVCGGCAWC